ncbi:MAG: B12-binding domain-containing radical SAM protein [bacterium]|nr:B12-binding domain-containing radical SAM protein [bacterium]
MSSWYSLDREPAMLSLPMGLLSLAAVLEQSGHEVSLVDFNYALAEGEIRLDEDFYADASAKILSHEPEVVGFSTMCNSYHIALRLAEAVKRKLPQVPVVFGGPQASVADVETLEAFAFVDLILRDEAEESLPLLLAALSTGGELDAVPGLTRRRGREVVRHPDAPLVVDLDSLPIPAYHLFPYEVGSSPALDVGRGCPFACSFCSTSTFWRRRFRLKSVDRILEEMRGLQRDHGASHFTFMHDLFTVNRRRLLEFCDRLLEEKMEVEWSCSSRVDCVDREVLARMAEAGCEAIFYGVESGSPRMQKEIRKDLDLEQVRTAVDQTLESEMRPTFSFIAGFPTETTEDLVETMDLVEELLRRPMVNVQLHLLAPQLATPDYDDHGHRLRWDGYYSDISGADYRFLEPEWFRRHPRLFTSFYYFETEGIRRELLRGLDLFVHGPCSQMRGTVLGLLGEESSLWQTYEAWHTWATDHRRGGGPMTNQTLDEFLLDFYEFAADTISGGRAKLDLGHVRDEILAFYLRHYDQTPVRFVPAPELKGTTATRQGTGAE